MAPRNCVPGGTHENEDIKTKMLQTFNNVDSAQLRDQNHTTHKPLSLRSSSNQHITNKSKICQRSKKPMLKILIN